MIRYFDNCATTRVDDDILEIQNKYQREEYFNPSSLNKYSLAVKKDLTSARDRIKKVLGFSGNVLFTSGGTESDNLAVLGCLKTKGNIVCNSIEHSAIFNVLQNLKGKGFEVRYASVKADGHCDFDSFLSLCDSNTVLAVCMHVSNDTGAVNDIKTLFRAVKAKVKGVVCLSDGVQAVGKIPVNVDDTGVDLYSFSSHKLHSTKGMGALLVKNSLQLNPQTYGGGQENGIRNGTEFVAGAIALSYAVEKASALLESNTEKYLSFKRIIAEKMETVDFAKIVCESECSPAILSYVFANIKGEVLLHMLEQYDVIVGHGSACSSKNKTPRIIAELKLGKEYNEGLIRISFSKYNSEEDVRFLADKLAQNASNLRKIIGVK